MFLSDKFLSEYNYNAPFGGDGLGAFVYLRTYARWDEEKLRREDWKDTVKRVVNYSMELYQGPINKEDRIKEAEELFDAIYNLRMFTSGRTLWTGGTEASKKYPLSNYNCAFTVIDNFQSMCDAFYLLMIGAGVGFRILPEDVDVLPEVNTSIVVAHKPYHPKEKPDRLEFTQVYEGDGSVYIIVGDSKEGWVGALKAYLESTQRTDIESIVINYDSVRPSGEKLKTFGGRASGHQALRDMFRSIHKVIKSGDNKLTPLQVLDIMNFIGNGVVVGGVRRTAQIALFDINDTDVLDAKVDMWTEGTKNFGQVQRSMSNNTIAFKSKPSREQLLNIFNRIQSNGEPGVLNTKAAEKRRPNFQGTNPCAEILLADKGLCNLTEINLAAHIKDHAIDWTLLKETAKLAIRVNMRMTNRRLELPEWDAVQQRDRLLGIGLTGVMDVVDQLNLTEEQLAAVLQKLAYFVDTEVAAYAKEMRIPVPLLSRTIKPSGTLSQLPTVSSGVHRPHAPYYIRRVRISSLDPLAKVMLNAGFPVFPENGQGPKPEEFAKLSRYDKMQTLEKATTWVIEFPVKTPATKKASEETAVEQFNRYLLFQEHWTEHNTSITISFSPEEIPELVDSILDNWDKYIGISFLPKFDSDSSPYPLMPYQTISENEYNTRADLLRGVNHEQIIEDLVEIEREQAMSELLDSDCDSGVCAVR